MNKQQMKKDCDDTPKQICIDIFNSFDDSEIIAQSQSVQNGWEAGRKIIEGGAS